MGREGHGRGLYVGERVLRKREGDGSRDETSGKERTVIWNSITGCGCDL